MGLKDKVKNFLQSIIQEELESIKELEPKDAQLPKVRKAMTYEQEMYMLEVLQRGNITEICSAAQSIMSGNNSFWSSVDPNSGIPLKHSGMCETIVKTILNIVTELYEDVDFSQEYPEEKEVWLKVNEDQNFQNLLISAIMDTLFFGDVSLLINYSDKIELDYKKGRNLEYVYDDFGQLKEIVALKKYTANNKEYLFKTFYGADALYVLYRLYNTKGEEVPLNTIEELADLKDIEIMSDGKYVDCAFATQFLINKSTKYEGRGASIFSSKFDALDSLDEIISQRQSVLRSGSPKEFIDESCLVRDGQGRVNITQTAMHKFYEKANSSINANGKDVEVLQSEIRAEEYRIYEEDAKRRVLEGILSEQTVSNTSVINNTSITKEREKQTNYTISNIKKAVQEIIPRYVYNIITIYYIYNNMQTDISPTDIFVNFEEYNNPSFETQVETCAKIKQQKVLPNFEMLQELYGNTKTDEEIAMIARKLDIMDGYDVNALYNLTGEEMILNDEDKKPMSSDEIKQDNKEDLKETTENKQNLKQEEENKAS